MDDGLLLLLQQLDQLLLGADVAPDPPVDVVEEADDGGLFVEAEGKDTGSALKLVTRQVFDCADMTSLSAELGRSLKNVMQESWCVPR